MFGDDINDTFISVYEVLQAVFGILVTPSIADDEDWRILARLLGTICKKEGKLGILHD